MPLVKRDITTRGHTANTKRTRISTMMIAPEKVESGDMIARPSHQQIASFGPDEFVEVPDEDTPEFEAKRWMNHGNLKFQPGLYEGENNEVDGSAFIELEWRDAVELVQSLATIVEQSDDEDEVALQTEKLEAYFAAEATKSPPRKSVMKAFLAAGLGGAEDFLS